MPKTGQSVLSWYNNLYPKCFRSVVCVRDIVKGKSESPLPDLPHSPYEVGNYFNMNLDILLDH